ncbi:MAG TPA: phosphatidylglycerophosphatase A [Usitatibacter sp.]|jgi:phosphatidylglycerophosphatase A|nr:phosphatidylglycerophosphatase A [Usitatibacter sp.]
MAAATTTSRTPDARFLVSHPAHFIALGFGAGLAPRAPGTFGTLVAIPLTWLLLLALPALLIAFAAIPLFFLGVWASTITARDLGSGDPGCIVIDEIVAFLPLCALSLPGAIANGNPVLLALAFGLFRFFDIVKPPPIKALEKNVKGGLGVMIDDVVAAFYAYVVFAIFIVVGYKVLGLS